MAFKYTGKQRRIESVVRRSRESSGDFDSYIKSEVSMYKPAEGENFVRIMPATWDIDEYGDGWELPVFIHYGVGGDNAVYLCLEKMQNKPCPVCTARAEATDKEEADGLKANKRLLCYVIDRDNEKAGPQVWSMPASLFRDINSRSIDKRSGGLILLDDPDEGYDISFIREGSKLNTKYVGVDVERDPCPLNENEKKQARWLQYIQDNPLPSILQYYEAERIEKVLYGGSAKREDVESEDEDETPRRSRRAAEAEDSEDEEQPRRSRRSREVEEEPEEEDETPRRSRASRAVPEDEEDDETPRRRRRVAEEEPEDEPEEEDTPRRSRRPAREEEPEEEETPRRSRRVTAEEDSGEEDEDPSEQAKESMSRLRSRRSK